MIFTYNKWDSFCEKLSRQGIFSIPASEVSCENRRYVVLKHDVETNVSHAVKMAKIEHWHGHRGSYYVQAYLLESTENIQMLKNIQALGHEVSYHYDVMDACKGDLDAACVEFEKNRLEFEKHGFRVMTVCQHGNPVVERIGYHSNRDFFRSAKVRSSYPGISDIMVDYPETFQTDYLYFSDAGRMFKRIYDPINNDIINSDEKNVAYENLDELLSGLSAYKGNIISTHPHRWTDSAAIYLIKTALFKIVKRAAKLLMKVPIFKK